MSQPQPNAIVKNEVLLLVCRSCGQEDSIALAKWLRQDSGLRGEFKVVLTDCLDICQAGLITVAAPGPLEGIKAVTRYLTVDPRQDRQALSALISSWSRKG